jgi:hypothetical protein
MNLTLDLFSESEVLQDRAVSEAEALRIREATERSRALREDLVFPAETPEPESTTKRVGVNHNMHAFIAQARHHGQTDPALTDFTVDGAGRRHYDEREVARFANELLCGVRSDRPTMTPERWTLAIMKARELGRKP